MNGFDLIFLSELKSNYAFSVPGFMCIRSQITPNEERGGVAVLFKTDIFQHVYDISCEQDQVWFRISLAPNIYFGAVYIPPSDSLYFSPDSFALLHSRACLKNQHVVVMGDLNARHPNLSQYNDPNLDVKYIENVDLGTNSNGRSLQNLCNSSGIRPLNHMTYRNTVFHGGLTYKQGRQWISQLDWGLVSQELLSHVNNFTIIQQTPILTDHAALHLELVNLPYPVNDLLCRAKQLGESYVRESTCTTQPIPFHTVDPEKFCSNPPSTIDLWEINDIEYLCDRISADLHTAAKSAKRKRQWNASTKSRNAHERWQSLLQSKDDRKIWQSINWHGSFDTAPDQTEQPSDEEFTTYYEELLRNPQDVDVSAFSPTSMTHIPILDDPITPNEVDCAIKSLKPNKAAGADGVPPGILKLLTAEWILLLTHLFNCVFLNNYPECWSYAKVFNIHKKGNKLCPQNYRGISILNAIAKVYDLVLCNRFTLWYQPREEQAGAQKGRNCEEQILVIRLLIEIARKCRKTLFITFIDYQKAYDKVCRWKLLQHLDRKGCGNVFLKALASCLSNTLGLIGRETFCATSGVRQGASTSCPLFTFFLDHTIDVVNQCEPDDWLGSLHMLLFMDDTVLLATSRQQMEKKLRALKSATDEIGMVIHPSKSRFMCLNSQSTDKFLLGNVEILHTNLYTYLGAPISTASIAQQVQKHIDSKMGHTFKFTSFLMKNSDVPFTIKKSVWESALKSSLFYSCETWLTENLRTAETVYMMTLKRLLNVRTTTCNDLILTELGIGDTKSFVRQRQFNFVHKLMSRDNFEDSIVGKVIADAISKGTTAGRLLKTLIDKGPDYNFIRESQEDICSKIRLSQTTRRITYMSINPQLSPPRFYFQDPPIQEHYRVACTRLRLSSHRLRIETGRWTRTPYENRLCECGEIQTEEHVLLRCPNTANLRQNHNIDNNISLSDFFSKDYSLISPFCFSILNYYSHV